MKNCLILMLAMVFLSGARPVSAQDASTRVAECFLTESEQLSLECDRSIHEAAVRLGASSLALAEASTNPTQIVNHVENFLKCRDVRLQCEERIEATIEIGRERADNFVEKIVRFFSSFFK